MTVDDSFRGVDLHIERIQCGFFQWNCYIVGRFEKASGPDRLTNECLKDALGVLLVPLTNLFNFCFSHGCCPPQWCHSYLLTLHKGNGSKSDPNSARGIALQSRLLNIILYCYLLDQRLYHWAEAQSLIPREQHGFRSGKSTMSAIAGSFQIFGTIMEMKWEEKNFTY